MTVIELLWICIRIYFIVDFLFLIVGWLVAKIRPIRRFGISILATSIWSCFLLPKICHEQCNGSCKNWTCPKFHRERGKYEIK